MLVVGLTGGIATGKSTVSSLLKSYNVPVIDADVLARQVVSPGTRALARIVAEFGQDILKEDGTLNRPKLGDIVFRDDIKRKRLNAIIHPAVRRAMLWSVLKYWLHGEKLCILDVPLLIEAGLWKWVGWIVVVYWQVELMRQFNGRAKTPDSSEQVQLTRLMKRDESDVERASARVAAQMPIAEKLNYADYVLDNSGSLKEAEEQVRVLLKKLDRCIGRWWWIDWVVPPFGILSAGWTLLWRFHRKGLK